jgi:hypothetical protein
VEYRITSRWLCWSVGHKARMIEAAPNQMAKDGWRFVSLDAVTFLGCDVGYYLVLGRESQPPA